MKEKIKTKSLTYALILILTFTTLATFFSSVNAQEYNVDTTALITITPNPIGVNQQVAVTFQIDKLSPTISSVAGGPGQDFFTGFVITITKPDGSTVRMPSTGSYTVTAGSQSTFLYSPDMIGTYDFVVDFPGQTIVSTRPGFIFPAGTFNFLASTGSATLVVQEDPIPAYSDFSPVPTDYWQRPINSENKGWWQVADDWLLPAYDYPTAAPWGQTYWARYASAPDSPHVLWKKPIYFGGIVGGHLGDESFYTGLTYEEFFVPAIIQQGRIIYTEHGPTASGDVWGTRIIDLYSGEDIMFLEGITIDFAQNVAYDSGNEHGVLPYLWDRTGSTYDMYDSFSANYILTIENVPSGLQTIGPKGEILIYGFSGTPADRYYWMWNSSLCIGGSPVWHYPNTPGSVYSEEWSPRVGSVIPGAAGIQWNVSVPTQVDDVTGRESPQIAGQGYQIGDPNSDGYMLAAYIDKTDYPWVYHFVGYPAKLDRQSDGTYPDSISHLWSMTQNDLYAALGLQKVGYEGVGPDLIFAYFSEDTLDFHGYSMETGHQLWETEPLTSGLAIYTYAYRVANGFLYEGGFDGVLRAYNATTGLLAWEHNQGNAGYENVYGGYPIYTGFTIADDKIYVSTDEHSPDAVMWRGGKLQCVDANTGEHLWDVSGWFRRPLIADGILTALNSLDGQVYAFGKGASATTVSAPMTAITKGSSVMLTGSVTDQTPALKDTPAISDENMGDWMEYMFMQKPRPEDAIGVPVRIQVVDPDNQYAWIGTATSDSYGNFGYSFIPQKQGTYTIIATFDGSDSYWGSTSTTYLTVDPAPPTITIPPYPDYQGPSAQEVANNVVNNLPENPTSSQIAQAVVNAMPEYPETPESPDYTNIFIVLIAAIAIVAVLVVYAIYKVNKIK